MAFDFLQFFRTNKKFTIWAAFFALVYLVRELFGLVFITFIICYIFDNLVVFLVRRIPIHRKIFLVAIYVVFLCLVTGMLLLVMPHMASQTQIFLRQFPESLESLHKWLDGLAGSYPYGSPLFQSLKETLTLNNLLGMNTEDMVSVAVRTLNRITHYITYFFLGTLFSFFILFDLKNLSAKTRALGNSRFRDVYEETAESVVRFAMGVGAAFQAQILIAMANTFLTALGLWLLSIQPVALLSVIVFFSGLVPVLGTFISSVPILLLAFNAGGGILALKAAGMIIMVHAVETYFLNPNIVSAVLKINPVLTLIILYIGHSLFGIWGVLLGVPASAYIYRYFLLADVNK